MRDWQCRTKRGEVWSEIRPPSSTLTGTAGRTYPVLNTARSTQTTPHMSAAIPGLAVPAAGTPLVRILDLELFSEPLTYNFLAHSTTIFKFWVRCKILNNSYCSKRFGWKGRTVQT